MSDPRGHSEMLATWRSRMASWDGVIVVVTVVALVLGAALVDNFGTSTNFTFLVLDLLPIAIVALTMTLVVISGEIDLSVASTLGLSSAVMGDLWVRGLTIETIIPICLVLGAVLGAVNGFFVTVLGLPALAVTIGTLALYRGLAYVVLGDRAVADFPFSYTGWATGTIGEGPVPNVLLLLVPLALVVGILLHLTPAGRSLFAIGSNDQAARFSGIRVARTKFLLFVASGTMSALAGVLWTLRYSSARADNGFGLELAVVAAVLLGGVSIFGGTGSLPGVLAGVILLASLQNALRLEDVSGESLNIVTGTLLIFSVLLPNLVAGTRARWRRLRRRRTPAPPPTRDDGAPGSTDATPPSPADARPGADPARASPR